MRIEFWRWKTLYWTRPKPQFQKCALRGRHYQRWINIKDCWNPLSWHVLTLCHKCEIIIDIQKISKNHQIASRSLSKRSFLESWSTTTPTLRMAVDVAATPRSSGGVSVLHLGPLRCSWPCAPWILHHIVITLTSYNYKFAESYVFHYISWITNYYKTVFS